ncbi:hypothetical protein HPB49_002890 [Dermacentor silvarum]|uniref:Uncharacterized protein n=1 Tax=Dermacentor silvarum TaxID=543639 RepID=A0ACB8DAM1_DERSI|nr:hypothetical protein HPB49_002890 [Dermacentor silvarum]
MLKGWFDAFRTEGGPTLYAYANRTAVTEDMRNILIYVCFSTLFIAFIIVFPGIRKEVSASGELLASMMRSVFAVYFSRTTLWHDASPMLGGLSNGLLSRLTAKLAL